MHVKIQLFSVMFYVVRAAHKLNFRLVINEIHNKWRTVEKGHTVTPTRMLDTIYVCSPVKSSQIFRESTLAVQVSCMLWSKRHYEEVLISP